MTAAAPYIVARNHKQAHVFAREELGLRPGRYRVVTSAGMITALRNVKLYLAPGWKKSPFAFALKTALRYTRMEVIDAEQGLGIRDDLEPAGKQLVLLSEWAAGGEALINSMHQPIDDAPTSPQVSPQEIEELEAQLEPEGWEPPESLDAEQVLRLAAGESGADVAPTQPTEDKRRRRRCKNGCGILVHPDEIEAHKATCTGD